MVLPFWFRLTWVVLDKGPLNGCVCVCVCVCVFMLTIRCSIQVHVYCGHGLRANPTSLRDLYCVVGVDGLNRARSAVQTGAINFDWDEMFDIDLLDAETVSFGVYSWAARTGL